MDKDLAQILEDNGYFDVRELPDGTVCGLIRLAFTTAICIDIDDICWRRRYCYTNLADARGALNDLKTGQDIPTGWVAKRPE